jgi:hypothetical protein
VPAVSARKLFVSPVRDPKKKGSNRMSEDNSLQQSAIFLAKLRRLHIYFGVLKLDINSEPC